MSYSSGMTSPGLSLTAVSTRASRFAGRAAVLAARWAEVEPKAKAEGLTTSSDIDADGGMVSIGGGGVTCIVMVNNEPPLVNRTCQDG